jgi:hypothetical protein
VSANGQSIEYSVALTSTGTYGAWQPGTHFTGLVAEKKYTAYARSAANAFYNAGEPISSEAFTTLGKGNGATVSAPTLASKTHNRIVINAVAAPSNGQTVEYAISETNDSTSVSGWQTGTIFTRLTPNKGYYVFARAKENDDYKAGTATVSAQITTNTGPTPNPNVPPFIIDFENDVVGKTYNATNAAGGNPDVKVVNDPNGNSYSSQRSLQISTSGDNAWNRGAIIPINLPFELQNYQSFTFRFYLISGSNIVNNISVYLKGDSNYASGGFGNGPDSTYTKFPELLVGDVAPVYSSTNQWVEYEIDIDPDTLNTAIKTLSGNVYLAIGINHGNALTYLFDDLTFNAVSSFTPPAAAISPTTATFVKANAADINVTVYPYGKTLSGISGGNPAITTTDYTVTDIDTYSKKVTLSSEYLKTQSVGDFDLTFDFGSGTPSTRSIKITIRDQALLTEYNFATDSPAVTTSGDLSASVTGGVLKVEKTANNHSTAYLIIPFDLGSSTLGSYSKILIEFRGVSDDYNYKTLQVEVQPNGTAPAGNTNFGSVNNHSMPSTFNNTVTTVNRTGNASTSMTGQINVIISLNNTSNFVYEIKSIRFE